MYIQLLQFRHAADFSRFAEEQRYHCNIWTEYVDQIMTKQKGKNKSICLDWFNSRCVKIDLRVSMTSTLVICNLRFEVCLTWDFFFIKKHS
jgi:penicillin-binding protein-related factor A (putative recombinase)